MDDSDEFPDVNATSPLLKSRGAQNGINGYGREHHGSISRTGVEDFATYKSRWRSLRVMYFIQLLAALTFSITMSSIWPFLKVLKPSSTASFVGWVVASYSLGQLVASPLFGAWSNMRKSTKEPMIVSLLLGIFANVFYMYLQSLPDLRNYFMIVSRFFIGFSAGNVAVLRSYVSGATTVKERTACMANVSICQVLGFIMGPVLQAALVPISYPGPVESSAFHFNMYTSPAFISALASLASLLLMLFSFREHLIDDGAPENKGDIQGDIEPVERELKSVDHSKSLQLTKSKPDYVAVFSTIYLFFTTLFMFTMLETIATPVTMHMYGWSKSQATFYQGFILGGGGFVSFIVFCGVKPLVKKFSERSLLLMGFIFCFFGYFGFVSWGSQLPPLSPRPIKNDSTPVNTSYSSFASDAFLHLEYVMSNSENLPHSTTPHPSIITSKSITTAFVTSSNVSTVTPEGRGSTTTMGPGSNASSTTPRNTVSTMTAGSTSSAHTGSTNATTIHRPIKPEGCPWNYDWCYNTPVIYLAQYLCASTLVSIGYPLCQVFSYIIFSKVLGPAPQGLWMGWLTAAGSLARTLGPIYISNMYHFYGPRVTYGSCAALVFLTILICVFVYRRLVPYSPHRKPSPLLKFGRNGTRTLG